MSWTADARMLADVDVLGAGSGVALSGRSIDTNRKKRNRSVAPAQLSNGAGSPRAWAAIASVR